MESAACPAAFARAPRFAALPWARDAAGTVWVPMRDLARLLCVSVPAIRGSLASRHMAGFHSQDLDGRICTLARAACGSYAFAGAAPSLTFIRADAALAYVVGQYQLEKRNLADSGVLDDVLELRAAAASGADPLDGWTDREICDVVAELRGVPGPIARASVTPAELALLRRDISCLDRQRKARQNAEYEPHRLLRGLAEPEVRADGSLLVDGRAVSRELFLAHWLRPL